MMSQLSPFSVRAEPVEALFFRIGRRKKALRQAQGEREGWVRTSLSKL